MTIYTLRSALVVTNCFPSREKSIDVACVLHYNVYVTFRIAVIRKALIDFTTRNELYSRLNTGRMLHPSSLNEKRT